MIMHVRQQIAVPDVVLDNGGQVTAGKTAAPIELLLDVRGPDGQNVAVPLSGGESHEGVRRIVGRMRTAVHPDRPVLHVRADVLLVGDDFLRRRVFLFPDSELQRSAVDMRKAVGLALMLEKIHAADIIRFRVTAGGVVDGTLR